MRFELDENGAWIVDPEVLAERLGITSAYLQRQEAREVVNCRVETGGGLDLGRSRVTVVVDHSGWQGLFDREGALISEHTFEPISVYDFANRLKPGPH